VTNYFNFSKQQVLRSFSEIFAVHDNLHELERHKRRKQSLEMIRVFAEKARLKLILRDWIHQRQVSDEIEFNDSTERIHGKISLPRFVFFSQTDFFQLLDHQPKVFVEIGNFFFLNRNAARLQLQHLLTT
jgi:hypothetical protein